MKLEKHHPFTSTTDEWSDTTHFEMEYDQETFHLINESRKLFDLERADLFKYGGSITVCIGGDLCKYDEITDEFCESEVQTRTVYARISSYGLTLEGENKWDASTTYKYAMTWEQYETLEEEFKQLGGTIISTDFHVPNPLVDWTNAELIDQLCEEDGFMIDYDRDKLREQLRVWSRPDLLDAAKDFTGLPYDKDDIYDYLKECGEIHIQEVCQRHGWEEPDTDLALDDFANSYPLEEEEKKRALQIFEAIQSHNKHLA